MSLIARAECPAGRHIWVRWRRVCHEQCIYHESRFCDLDRCATCGVGWCNYCRSWDCEHAEPAAAMKET